MKGHYGQHGTKINPEPNKLSSCSVQNLSCWKASTVYCYFHSLSLIYTAKS
jgi:hypothetical protein